MNRVVQLGHGAGTVLLTLGEMDRLGIGSLTTDQGFLTLRFSGSFVVIGSVLASIQKVAQRGLLRSITSSHVGSEGLTTIEISGDFAAIAMVVRLLKKAVTQKSTIRRTRTSVPGRSEKS